MLEHPGLRGNQFPKINIEVLFQPVAYYVTGFFAFSTVKSISITELLNLFADL